MKENSAAHDSGRVAVAAGQRTDLRVVVAVEIR